MDYKVSISADTTPLVQQINNAVKNIKLQPINVANSSRELNTLATSYIKLASAITKHDNAQLKSVINTEKINQAKAKTIISNNSVVASEEKAYQALLKTEVGNNNLIMSEEKVNQAKAKTAIANNNILISNEKATQAQNKTILGNNNEAVSEQKLQQEIAKTTIAQEKATQAGLKTQKMTEAQVKANTTLAQTFVNTTKKVGQFYLASLPIRLITTIINEAKEAVFGLDASMTELIKVSDLGGQSLANYKQQAYELAEGLKASAINVTDAVTEFKKSGFSLDESLKLSESALVFQTIADEALTAGESATFLTQTLKGFNMEVDQAERVISAVNEVSNNFAISSGDLSQNIGKVTAVANLAGVSFEELIGLMTASNTVIQNSSKVANAYKSILTNLINKDLESQFNQFGLTQRDVNGAMKDGYTQLQELATVFRELGTTVDGDTGEMISLNDVMNELLEDIGGKCYMSHKTGLIDGEEGLISLAVFIWLPKDLYTNL